jgi:hypothetical protein
MPLGLTVLQAVLSNVLFAYTGSSFYGGVENSGEIIAMVF